jgi:hypothetical protein
MDQYTLFPKPEALLIIAGFIQYAERDCNSIPSVAFPYSETILQSVLLYHYHFIFLFEICLLFSKIISKGNFTIIYAVGKLSSHIIHGRLP